MRLLSLTVALLLMTACTTSASPEPTDGTVEVEDAVELTGPGMLATTPFGVAGLVNDAPASAFYLGGAALAYSVGESIVFQSFDGAGVERELGIAHDRRVRSLVSLNTDEETLVQGITPAGDVVLLGHDEVDDSDFGVLPGRRWLRFLDPGTGSVLREVDVGSGPEVGPGRVSVAEDMMVLSMRQSGCTWLEFRDLDGEVVEIASNPRPEADACSAPLITDAVLSPDGGYLAYVATSTSDFPYEAVEQPPNQALGLLPPISPPLSQSLVIVETATGDEISRQDLASGSSTAGWVEPTPDGVIVTMTAFDPEFGLYMPTAPRLGDFTMSTAMSASLEDLSAVFVDWNGSTSDLPGVTFATYSPGFDTAGVCSGAVRHQAPVGPFTESDGMGNVIEVTVHQPSAAADATRDRIRSAARTCNWAALDVIISEGSRPFTSDAEDPDPIGSWRRRELGGDPVLARLVDLLQWPPVSEDPYEWNGVRGDTISPGVVEISDGGEWLSYTDG